MDYRVEQLPAGYQLDSGAPTGNVSGRSSSAGSIAVRRGVRGLSGYISVQAPETRDGSWDDQVDTRVGEVLGTSPVQMSRKPRDRLRTGSRSMTPPSSPGGLMQATQPLGESALAADYARQSSPAVNHAMASTSSDRRRSHSPRSEDSSQDGYPDDDDFEMPPASQVRMRSRSQSGSVASRDSSPSEHPYLSDEDHRSVTPDPFRFGGGSRAEGSLSEKRTSAGSADDGERRDKRVKKADGRPARGWGG